MNQPKRQRVEFHAANGAAPPLRVLRKLRGNPSSTRRITPDFSVGVSTQELPTSDAMIPRCAARGPAAVPVDDSSTKQPTRSAELHETLVLRHTDLVRAIARQVAHRLPAHVEIEDLVQAGMLGLLEAIQRCHTGATFKAYARCRVRGAIIDYVRKLDWRPRSLNRRLRDIETARWRIECETGAAAKPAAVVLALGWSVEAFHRTLRDVNTMRLVSLDEPDRADESPANDATLSAYAQDPADNWERTDMCLRMAASIDALPARDRTILLLYYESEVCLREIGTKLGISESRVCQILRQSVSRLRRKVLAAGT